MPQPAFQPTVTLRVPDLSEARTFYETIVGLTPLDESDDRLALGAPDGDQPVVDLLEAPDAPPRGRDAAGLFHLAIRLPTRESLSEALKRVSREEYGLTGASDHAVSEALYTNDPAGNGVELYTDRPRSAWERDDSGEIHMTTERLDIDDLWRATDGQPADRVPDDTRLGHVHLEVTDLEAALAFYRDTLGMEVQTTRPGAAFLSYDGYHHHVALNVWNHRRQPHDDNQLGLAALTARVDDQRFSQVADRTDTAPDDGTLELRDPDGMRTTYRI